MARYLAMYETTMFSVLAVKGGEGKDMAGIIPSAVDGHEDLVSFGQVLHLKDQHAKGCTIVGGGAEEGGVKLDKVLGVATAQAGQNVPLSLVDRGKGIPLLL